MKGCHKITSNGAGQYRHLVNINCPIIIWGGQLNFIAWASPRRQLHDAFIISLLIRPPDKFKACKKYIDITIIWVNMVFPQESRRKNVGKGQEKHLFEQNLEPFIQCSKPVVNHRNTQSASSYSILTLPHIILPSASLVSACVLVVHPVKKRHDSSGTDRATSSLWVTSALSAMVRWSNLVTALSPARSFSTRGQETDRW